MARIRDLKLQLVGHDPAGRNATVRVSYAAELTPLERGFPGLQFKEKIQLRGAYSLDPEDFLYELGTQTFADDGRGVVHRERLVTVADDILSPEGTPLADEVYAKVWVTPLLPRPEVQVSSLLESAF